MLCLFLFISGLVVSLSNGLNLAKSVSMREKMEWLQNADQWSVSSDPPPSVPAWPEQFNVQINIYVEDYGSDWSSKGIVYYDWKIETFRADYLKWCLPLFDSESAYDNYTCSFLATGKNMYFVNHTSSNWEDMECCMFAPGLAAVPPNWMDNCQYNGTTKIKDVLCDVWWFPGTSDPEKPCYGYWNKVGTNTPVQFFGLSSTGPTILEYFNFNPGQNPAEVSLEKPNVHCEKMCEPPLVETLIKAKPQRNFMWWPEWPSCE